MFTVYKHTTPNGKVYIGITGRKCKYRWDNGRGYIQNRYFYSAIQKYGWDNINHEILFEDLTEEEAKKKEIELIAKFKSNDRRFGYNHMSGGELMLMRHSEDSKEKMRLIKTGKIQSTETREKRSQSLKGHVISLETKKKISEAQKGKPRAKHTEKWKTEMSKRQTDNAWNMRAVCQLTKDGHLISEFISAKNAERATGIDNRNIIACCKGKRKTACGYKWAYRSLEASDEHF